MRFFVGGYNPDLGVARLEPEDGSIEMVGKVKTPENASFLRYVPERSVVYAAVESGYRTGETGKIAAYRVDQAGTLTAIGSAPSCGSGPCHVDVSPDGSLLAAANYGGENFSLIEVRDNGTLGATLACVHHRGSSVNRQRQEEPHPHATTFSPDGRFLFVCDLGTDRVMRYAVDALRSGTLGGSDAPVAQDSAEYVAATLRPGAGPRHLAFSSDAAFAYVITELANTVVGYRYDAASGGLTEVQELSTLPAGFEGESSAAEIQLHPGGRFLYASNRGHDTIAVFRRDESDGTLVAAGHFDTTGNGPRHFQVDPSGRWCLVSNQTSDFVASFRLDPETGRGTWSGRSMKVIAPACTEFWR